MPSLLAASATEEFPAFLTVPRPRRMEVGRPHHIVLHDLAEKHAVDVRVIDASSFEIWRKSHQSDAGCAARPSRSAEARLLLYGPFQLDCKVTRQECGEKAGYLTDQHPCWCCVLPYGTVTIGSARPRGARPI